MDSIERRIQGSTPREGFTRHDVAILYQYLCSQKMRRATSGYSELSTEQQTRRDEILAEGRTLKEEMLADDRLKPYCTQLSMREDLELMLATDERLIRGVESLHDAERNAKQEELYKRYSAELQRRGIDITNLDQSALEVGSIEVAKSSVEEDPEPELITLDQNTAEVAEPDTATAVEVGALSENQIQQTNNARLIQRACEIRASDINEHDTELQLIEDTLAERDIRLSQVVLIAENMERQRDEDLIATIRKIGLGQEYSRRDKMDYHAAIATLQSRGMGVRELWNKVYPSQAA